MNLRAIASNAERQGAEAMLKEAQQAMKALSFGRDQINADVLQRLLDAPERIERVAPRQRLGAQLFLDVFGVCAHARPSWLRQ